MSSPYDRGIGQNAVMCYFPDLPYYLSYQIGFDTLINPLQEQVDPTVAGQPMRLIYVPMYVPGGFAGNAATIAGMPRHHLFRNDVPQFFHRRPAFYPSTFSDFSHVTPRFDHHDSLNFGGPVILEEQHHHSHTRSFEYTGNGRRVEIMENNDTLHDIPPTNMCRELHREPDGVHNEPPQRSPKQKLSQKPQKQPRHSDQHPSTSGMSGQKDSSYASHSKSSQTDKSNASSRKAIGGVATVGSQTDKPRAASRKASGGVGTVTSQTDKSHASPCKASERVATDRKKRLRKKDKTNITQQMPDEHERGSPDDVQEIQPADYTLPEPAPVPIDIEILPPGLDGKDNDDNKAQDTEKPNRDLIVDDN